MLASFGLCGVEFVGSWLGTWVLHTPRGWTPVLGWAPGSWGCRVLSVALEVSLEPLGFSAGLIPRVCWGWDQMPVNMRLSLPGTMGSSVGSAPLPPPPIHVWDGGMA